MIVKKFIFVLFTFLITVNQPVAQSVEYAIKASFIEKFARLTDWPATSNNDYFIIDVLGKSPFKGELEEVAKKRKLKNKTIKINYIHNISEAKDCQVLFICLSERNELTEILNYTSPYHILSISDSPGFCNKGVHINFYVDESETVKYEVNPTALKKAKLDIDMQLLNFGKIIR